ncbi:MAG: type I-C CRISPR-associated protein Cas5c, partial [Burkholderiaceae bacterium]|nr:type I-C CRISPR-associated protein Cas5c [Burkholderiaceae bacterium]
AVVSTRNVQQAMAAGSGTLGLYIEDERQQRAGYFLRDVAYRIHADLSLAPGCTEPLMKYTEMFTRRASKGQCVNQPYLGCREFAADFRLVTADTPPATPIGDTRELGWMLHDLNFTHPADPQPRFFNARLDKGVVQVPPFEEAHG